MIALLLSVLAMLPVGDEKSSAEIAIEWNQKGVDFLQSNQVESAIAAFHKALQLKSDDVVIRKNLAVAYFQQGQTRLEKKNYELAISSFLSARDIDTETSRYPLFVGYAYFQWGNFPRAIEELNRVIQKFPKETDAHRLLGELYYNQSQHDKAAQSFEKALEQLQEKRDGEKEDEKKARLKKILEVQDFLARVKKDAKVEKNFTPDSSNHFDFLYDGTNRDDLLRNSSALARNLEDAYAAVGEKLGVYPDRRIQALFYEPKDFSETTGTDNWVGGLFDGKIRVPVKNYESEKARIRQVIFHEYTHAVIFTLTNNCPTWLNEGLAQLEEGLSIQQAEKRLKPQVANFLSPAELRGSFMGLKADRARVAYDMSLSLVQFLIRDFGYATITNYLRRLGQGQKSEAETFTEVFGQSFDDILARWQRNF